MLDLKGYSSMKDLVKDLIGALTVAAEEADKDVGEDFDKRVLEVVHSLNYVKVDDILRKMDLPYQDSLALERVKGSLDRLIKQGDLEYYQYLGKNWIHKGVRPTTNRPKLEEKKVSNG